MGSAFSDWWKTIFRILQGSILGPLLFNIFISDLFFFVLIYDISNFVDNSTMYFCNKLLSKILGNLCFDLKNVIMWFTVSWLKPNPGRLLIHDFRKSVINQLSLFINRIKIERTSEFVLLGLTIDDQLTFKTHVEHICRVAKYKLRALQRIRQLGY